MAFMSCSKCVSVCSDQPFLESLTAAADLRINGYLAKELRQSKLFLSLIAGTNDRKQSSNDFDSKICRILCSENARKDR